MAGARKSLCREPFLLKPGAVGGRVRVPAEAAAAAGRSPRLAGEQGVRLPRRSASRSFAELPDRSLIRKNNAWRSRCRAALESENGELQVLDI